MKIIEEDRVFVKSARKNVESQAKKIMLQGLETQVRRDSFRNLINHAFIISFTIMIFMGLFF